MNLKTLFLTNNDCFKSGKRHTVKGIMVHSTGATNPWLKRYVGPDDGLLGPNPYNNHWNTPKPGGRSVCVHAFIGKLQDGSIATYQTLPWDMVGWHSGSGSLGSAKNANNNGYIGFEICEDDLTDASYFNKVYTEAVELCAYLCKKFNLDPLADGVLICHSEGNKRGIASNHADVMHWFPRHGKNMDMFRAAVKAEMAKNDAPAQAGHPIIGKPTAYYVQTGAYSNKANADTQYYKVKAAGYDAIIKQSGGLFRVQVGAFSVKQNAENLAAKLKTAGFETYITTTGGTQVAPGPEPKQPAAKPVKVGSEVKIKASATKYATGQTIPGWVKDKTHIVSQISGDRVLLGANGGICSWVYLNDVEVVK